MDLASTRLSCSSHKTTKLKRFKFHRPAWASSSSIAESGVLLRVSR